ncbi:MAG: ABC transporter ATP-binding protein [Promethearchaeota archaeon]
MIHQTPSEMNISLFMLLFTIATVVLIGVFYVNAGDKMQMVPQSRIPYMVIVTILIGVIYEVLTFLIDQFFYDNIYLHYGFTISVTLIAGATIKNVNYRSIPKYKLRDLPVLEKGKELLSINNLKIYYPLYSGLLKRKIGVVKAVDGISFSIKTGETLGLVGESGCGKTTIAKHILGLVPKHDGTVLYKGEKIPSKYSKQLRQKIQIVFQDPDASLNPRLKVFDVIAEPLRNLVGISNKDELRNRVLTLMEQVSLKREHMDRYPHEFSGGQKQRIVIARSLACNPELIILDEPTSALDVSVQAQILNLLKDLQDDYGYGFLFITHNLSVVYHIADKVNVMYLGRFVEQGTVEQIFTNPKHPYTKALLESKSEIDPFDQEIKFIIKGEVPSPIMPPSGCTFNPRCPSKEKNAECLINPPERREIEEGHFVWCHGKDI